MTSLSVWGPKAWGFMEACAWAYPEVPSASQRDRMFQFLSSIGHVLPCSICRHHFSDILRDELPNSHSSPLDSRDNLSRWLCGVHNAVNVRTKKAIMKYETVRAMYAKPSSVCALAPTRHGNVLSAVGYFIGSLVLLTVIALVLKVVFRCRGCDCDCAS